MRTVRWILFVLVVTPVALFVLYFCLLFGGCIAAGDKGVQMPPLRVEGKVINPSGEPVANESVALGLSTWVYDGETLAAIREQRTPADHADSWVVRVFSRDDGTFSYTFPERFFIYPAAIFFGHPVGGDRSQDLRLWVVPNAGQAQPYWVLVHESDASIRAVDEEAEVPPGTTVSAQRGTNGDSLKLVLVVDQTSN